MSINHLNAISPIDGRYRNKTEKLAHYFSEEALIKYRVRVEIEYFIALCELPLPQLASFDTKKFGALKAIFLNFDHDDALAIKKIEKTTNHDVKAVEYFIKQRFDALGLEQFKEFIHFGLTSQDINNTAIPLSLKEAMDEVYQPLYSQLLEKISGLADEWKAIPMLARTHGQPATPTRLGKEVAVFAARLKEQHHYLETYSPRRKIRWRYRQLQCPSHRLPHGRLEGFRSKIRRVKVGIAPIVSHHPNRAL